jgi:hypothetical protein
LTASLNRLGFPLNQKFIQQPIIDAIVRNGAGQYEKVVGSHPTIKNEVIIAAHDAFGNGLHVALVTSAALVLVTAVLVFVSGRTRS